MFGNMGIIHFVMYAAILITLLAVAGRFAPAALAYAARQRQTFYPVPQQVQQPGPWNPRGVQMPMPPGGTPLPPAQTGGIVYGGPQSQPPFPLQPARPSLTAYTHDELAQELARRMEAEATQAQAQAKGAQVLAAVRAHVAAQQNGPPAASPANPVSVTMPPAEPVAAATPPPPRA